MSALDCVTISGPNRFTRTLDALDRLAAELSAPLAIVGGMAGLHHGTGVTTVDIDVVVPAESADALAGAASRAGWEWSHRSPRGWHRLRRPDPDGATVIELIPSGQRTPRDPADAPAIPTPQALGVDRGLGYAELGPWVMMKLVAGRDKDRYHLAELCKRIDEQRLGEIVQHLRQQPPQYLAAFHGIQRTAEQEDSRNW